MKNKYKYIHILNILVFYLKWNKAFLKCEYSWQLSTFLWDKC